VVVTGEDTARPPEWWARGRSWTGQPGSLALKLLGQVHREERRDRPARFQVVLFDDCPARHAQFVSRVRIKDALIAIVVHEVQRCKTK